MKTIERLFNTELTVYRRTRTDDGQGGWTESWVTGVTIKGRVCPNSTAQQIAGAQQHTDITHTFYCLAGANVLVGDRIYAATIATLDVVAIREPSWANYHLEIDCSEVQRGN